MDLSLALLRLTSPHLPMRLHGKSLEAQGSLIRVTKTDSASVKKRVVMKVGVKKDEIVKNDGRSERGASMVEYALLVSLIAVVAIVAVQALGTNIRNQFQAASDAIANQPPNGNNPAPAQ